MRFYPLSKLAGVLLLVLIFSGSLSAQVQQVNQQSKNLSTLMALKAKHNSQLGRNYDTWKQSLYENQLPKAIDHVDFPKEFRTGNPQADDANYAAAKYQWILDNQARYQAEMEGYQANRLRRTVQRGSTTIHVVYVGEMHSQSDAVALRDKLLAHPGVLQVSTQLAGKLCSVTVKGDDEHDILRNCFHINY